MHDRQRRIRLWIASGIGLLALATAAAITTALLAPSRDKGPCTAAYAHDGGLAAKVRDALADTGLAPTPLRDLTPFAWDTVYVVPWRRIADAETGPTSPDTEPADTPESLAKALGCDPQLPYRADFDLGSVLVFTHDGRVVHTLEVWYNLGPNTTTGTTSDTDTDKPKAWSSSTTTTRPLDDPSCIRCLVLTEPRPRKRYDSGTDQNIRNTRTRQNYGFTPAIPTNAGHLSAPAGMSSTANGL